MPDWDNAAYWGLVPNHNALYRIGAIQASGDVPTAIPTRGDC